MRSASGTGEEGERQRLRRPGRWAGGRGAGRSWARAPPYDSLELLSSLHTQEAPIPSNAPSLPPTPTILAGRGRLHMDGRGGNGGNGEELDSRKLLPGLVSSSSAEGCGLERRGTYQHSWTFLRTCPPSIPQRRSPRGLASFLPSTASAHLDRPPWRPPFTAPRFHPWASSPWAWLLGSALVCNLGPVGVSLGTCCGAGQERWGGQAKPPGPRRTWRGAYKPK